MAAVGVAALGLSRIAFFAGFATVLGLGAVAIAVIAVLLVEPLAKKIALPVAAPVGLLFSPAVGAALAIAVLAGAGWAGMRARVFATPQTIFAEADDVGRSIDFFDRRFGGADFIQVDYQGDLRDPSVAARLMRLTELLEGSPAAPDGRDGLLAFPDVRSASQILGFLSQGFGGAHRIPSSRESLANLWFFLEGRSEVRSLVLDQRDRAMIVLRTPSKPVRPVAELAAIAHGAVADSLKTGPQAAYLRLQALARVSRVALSLEQIEEVLKAAFAPMSDQEQAALEGEVNSKLRTWLDSGDSPYRPTDEEWGRLELALAAPEAERHARLTEVAASFQQLTDPAMAGQLVDSVLVREKDLRLNHRAAVLAARLFAADPARTHAQGIFADLLDPHENAGSAATVTVSGLPVMTEQLERDLLELLLRALALLLGIGTLALVVAERRPSKALRRFLEAAVATTLTLAIAGTFGPGIDSGCITLFLIPPLASLLAADSERLPSGILVALSAASATLLLVGLAPISRLGAAMAIALASVAVVQAISRRVG